MGVDIYRVLCSLLQAYLHISLNSPTMPGGDRYYIYLHFIVEGTASDLLSNFARATKLVVDCQDLSKTKLIQSYNCNSEPVGHKPAWGLKCRNTTQKLQKRINQFLSLCLQLLLQVGSNTTTSQTVVRIQLGKVCISSDTSLFQVLLCCCLPLLCLKGCSVICPM